MIINILFIMLASSSEGIFSFEVRSPRHLKPLTSIAVTDLAAVAARRSAKARLKDRCVSFFWGLGEMRFLIYVDMIAKS